MSVQASILIVEDEAAIADTLIFALQTEGFATQWETLGGNAITELQKNPFNLLVLDVGLPDINGFEVCRQIRKFSDIPIIFLTARGEEIDRIVGLEMGADDYVVKPFSPRELATRVKAILRRTVSASHQSQPTLFPAASLFRVDVQQLQIYYADEVLPLTKFEFQLLQVLLNHCNQVLSREQLLQHLHIATDAGYQRSIDTHIKSLRAKCKKINPLVDPIKTHRGFGYSLQAEPSQCP